MCGDDSVGWRAGDPFGRGALGWAQRASDRRRHAHLHTMIRRGQREANPQPRQGSDSFGRVSAAIGEAVGCRS